MSRETIKIKTRPVNFDKLNKKLNKKPIRWFWNSWRWIDYWYDRTSNGIYGPGGRTYLHFRTGKLALIISIIALIIAVLTFIGCKKNDTILPGNEPYCIECRNYFNVVLYDTCATLNDCNKYEIKVKKINNKINCYYIPQK